MNALPRIIVTLSGSLPFATMSSRIPGATATIWRARAYTSRSSRRATDAAMPGIVTVSGVLVAKITSAFRVAAVDAAATSQLLPAVVRLS